MRIVVSILNWNQEDQSLECVKSILKYNLSELTICVTDNNSVYFNKSKYLALSSDIQIFTNRANDGYATGHLKALNYTLKNESEIFWIINSDLSLKKDTLKTLLDEYAKKGEGIYGSIAVDHLGTKKHELIWKLKYKKGRQSCSFIPYSHQELATNKTVQVSNIVGYCFIIPVSVIRKFGFIDTSFFLYFEETDYCLRLLKKGVPVYLVSRSKVQHENLRGKKGNSPLAPVVEYYCHRNFNRLLLRNAPPIKVLVYLLSLIKRFVLANLIMNSKYNRIGKTELHGILHAFAGIKGKYYAPEDFID